MLAIASWVGIALWIGNSIEEAIADGFARSCSDSEWHEPEDTGDTGDTGDTDLWPEDTWADTGGHTGDSAADDSGDSAADDSGDTGGMETAETGTSVHTADTGAPLHTSDTAP